MAFGKRLRDDTRSRAHAHACAHQEVQSDSAFDLLHVKLALGGVVEVFLLVVDMQEETAVPAALQQVPD